MEPSSAVVCAQGNCELCTHPGNPKLKFDDALIPPTNVILQFAFQIPEPTVTVHEPARKLLNIVKNRHCH